MKLLFFQEREWNPKLFTVKGLRFYNIISSYIFKCMAIRPETMCIRPGTCYTHDEL